MGGPEPAPESAAPPWRSAAGHHDPPSATDPDAYRGCTVVFGTMHGKHRQVAPPFAEILGASVTAPPGLDTDRFGTFTGEIPRTSTPVEAARAKARLAITRTGTPYALASEASYGPLPGVGWPGHEELLLFLDDTRGIEIIEGRRSLAIPGNSHRVSGHAALAPEIYMFGSPPQALIVRPAEGGAARDIVKGITHTDRLTAAIAAAAATSTDGHALVEPDLRAHHNPTRRAVLSELGATLANRIATACPDCGTPGYGRVDTEPGLPCRWCGTPTERIRADIHGCARCPHRHTVPRPETTTEPSWCPDCNP